MRRVVDMSEISLNDSRTVKVSPVTYQKLVVPLRMRSIYWKYFGFPANEEKKIITKEIIVCLLCKTQMIYNRNTSNLRTHLRGRHKNVLSKIDLEAGISEFPGSTSTRKSKLKTQLRVNSDGDIDFNDITLLDEVSGCTSRSGTEKEVPTMVVSEEGNGPDLSNISIVFPNNEDLDEYNENRVALENTDAVEISDAIVNFIISDLIPTSVINGPGFHRLVSSLSVKSIMIPNEKKLTVDFLPSLYTANREILFNNIMAGNINSISLSLEEFVCADNVKCLSIYAHLLFSGDPILETKLLSTISCTGIDTVEHWAHVLDEILSEWNINFSAVSAVVLSCTSPELRTVLSEKEIVQLPCFLFFIQELCNKHIFQQPVVASLLTNCRESVKIAQEEQIVEDEHSEMREEDNEEELGPFGYDNSESWLTTYYMLQGLLLRKKNILENSSASNRCPLNLKDWKDLKDFVDLLQPLKAIVTTLFEEKNSIISLLNPLVWRMSNSSFEIDINDSFFIRAVKEIVKQHLNDAYDMENVRDFMQMATFLDPRFKSLTPEDSKQAKVDQLIDSLTQLVQVDGLIDDDIPQENATPKKPNRMSGINMLFGNFQVKKNEVTLEDKVKNEVRFYDAASDALLDECPLEWWQHMRHRCPNLIKLAHKYLCVPSLIKFSGHKDVSDYIKFYKKRSALQLNTLDMILFLHAHKKF